MKHKKINKLKFIFSLSERKLLAEGYRLKNNTENTKHIFEIWIMGTFIHLKCYEGRWYRPSQT